MRLAYQTEFCHAQLVLKVLCCLVLTSVRWRLSWPVELVKRPLVDVAEPMIALELVRVSTPVAPPRPIMGVFRPIMGPRFWLNSCAIIEADSLMVVDSKRIANSSPLSFQLSFWHISMFFGVKLRWISLQIACKKFKASRICSRRCDINNDEAVGSEGRGRLLLHH